MSAEAGVLVLGRGHIDSILKIILIFIFPTANTEQTN